MDLKLHYLYSQAKQCFKEDNSGVRLLRMTLFFLQVKQDTKQLLCTLLDFQDVERSLTSLMRQLLFCPKKTHGQLLSNCKAEFERLCGIGKAFLNRVHRFIQNYRTRLYQSRIVVLQTDVRVQVEESLALFHRQFMQLDKDRARQSQNAGTF